MEYLNQQAELFGLVWRPSSQLFRLRVNDVLRIDGRLCRVIRVSECAAVLLMNRPTRTFTTRFDKQVRFRPSPFTFRISPNSETIVLNRNRGESRKRNPRETRRA